MGFYIETQYNLDKADQLLEAYPEIREVLRSQLQWDTTGQNVIVCVVNNGPFDAAAICFSLNELRAFSLPEDNRPKRWLVVPRDLVVKLCPSVEKMLVKVS